MDKSHPLIQYVEKLKTAKTPVLDRHVLIDDAGRVVYASPKMLKECVLETPLPAPHAELVSKDLYISSLSDVLYDIQTSEKSTDVLRKRFDEAWSQGVTATSDRLNAIAGRFSRNKTESGTRTLMLSARFPAKSGHHNYKEYFTLVKEKGNYAGAVAEFEPVALDGWMSFLKRALHIKQPHELFHTDPKKVARIISVDDVQILVDGKLVGRNYLKEYVHTVMDREIVREGEITKKTQQGASLASVRAEYQLPQVVLDLRDITHIAKETPQRLAALLFAFERPDRTIVLGNASETVERAVYEGQEKFKSVVGRNFNFKALHFRTLTYAFHEYKTIPALEKKIKEELYPDANSIPNERVQPDVKDSERKGLDVLVDRESAEQQP
jgi:hypothetical protein